MADFDISFKIAAHTSSREFCWLRAIRPEVWEPIGDTLQTTERLADRAFRAEQGGERFIVYFEAYTTWRDDARWNILSKSSLLSEREQLPTYTLVFVLMPQGYREQDGTFQLTVAGRPTQQMWFEEICLWRERPQPWWESVPGLMALYPLCAHERPREDAIRYATQAIAGQVQDTAVRSNLLAALGIFGTLVYPDVDVRHLIGVELMRESKFLEDLAVEERIKAHRADVLGVLEVKFGPEKASEFKDILNTIVDANQLSELVRLAAKSRGVASFRRALQEQQS